MTLRGELIEGVGIVPGGVAVARMHDGTLVYVDARWLLSVAAVLAATERKTLAEWTRDGVALYSAAEAARAAKP